MKVLQAELKQKKKFKMISGINSVYLVAIFLMVMFCDLIAAQKFCHKVHFNRNTFPLELKKCTNGAYNRMGTYTIKDFDQNFRPTVTSSKPYLSNTAVNSCGELVQRLSLTTNSTIHAYIYLKHIQNEKVEIIVRDALRNDAVVNQFSHILYGNFNELVGRVSRDVPNAKVNNTPMDGDGCIFEFFFLSIFQIEIVATNITPQSLLAIEYFYVLNPTIDSEECRRPYQPEPLLVWWVIIAVSLGILSVILISVGIYCIIDRRQKHSNQPK